MSSVKSKSQNSTLFDELLNKSNANLKAGLNLPALVLPRGEKLKEGDARASGKTNTARSLVPKVDINPQTQTEKPASVYAYAGAKERKNILWEGADAFDALPVAVVEAQKNELDVAKAKSAAKRLSTGSKQSLDNRAKKIVAALPENLRPNQICSEFPHIMNLIAMSWSDPKDFVRTLDSLLVDDRGDRQGFPFAIIVELTELREHYFSAVRPESRKLWDRL